MFSRFQGSGRAPTKWNSSASGGLVSRKSLMPLTYAFFPIKTQQTFVSLIIWEHEKKKHNKLSIL